MGFFEDLFGGKKKTNEVPDPELVKLKWRKVKNLLFLFTVLFATVSFAQKGRVKEYYQSGKLLREWVPVAGTDTVLERIYFENGQINFQYHPVSKLTELEYKSLIEFIEDDCSSRQKVDEINPENVSELLGQKITVVGQAVNYKLGALILIGDSLNIWIDGRESWPEEYYTGESISKTIKVTGTLTERYDLPVFVYQEGEPNRSGIPVKEGTDLKAASHRYLLKNTSWEVVLE